MHAGTQQRGPMQSFCSLIPTSNGACMHQPRTKSIAMLQSTSSRHIEVRSHKSCCVEQGAAKMRAVQQAQKQANITQQESEVRRRSANATSTVVAVLFCKAQRPRNGVVLSVLCRCRSLSEASCAWCASECPDHRFCTGCVHRQRPHIENSVCCEQSIFHVSFLRGLFSEEHYRAMPLQNLDGAMGALTPILLAVVCPLQ